MDSILGQTFADWELVVIDSGSDDGSREVLQRYADADRRICLHQGPRDGIYNNLNRAVEQAAGEFLYVAPADDTMAPDFLEQTVQALEQNPRCDLAHAWIRFSGEDERELQAWWESGSLFACSSGKWLRRRHVRLAPYDGLLHLSGSTVFTSLTQLLIRRSLVERIGLFKSQWGSVGDFNWEMRAGLVANTVHVPETWGGWRVHRQQATAAVEYRSSRHESRIREMVEDAITSSASSLPERVLTRLQQQWAPYSREMRSLLCESSAIESRVGRSTFHLRKALQGSKVAWDHFKGRVSGRPVWPENASVKIREWLASEGIHQSLRACDDENGTAVCGPSFHVNDAARLA